MPDLRLKILLLCDYQPYNAATMVDHINALYYHSRHELFVLPLLNYFGEIPEGLDLDRFDCIIVHHSLTLVVDAYISPRSKQRLEAFRGLKAIFIQDEYRFVNRTIDALRRIGFHVLFTCVPETEIEKVYPSEKLPGLRKVNVLTGYVPAWLTILPARPLSRRRVHIGYRGRRYPQWHGRAGSEKWQIGERVKSDARRYGLRTDISMREEDRLYGHDWPRFLQRCKSVLAVESGCSVFDFDHVVGPATETYAELLKQGREDVVSVDEARELFFADAEERISLAQISPRCFEAIAVRTLLVLYEGEYSGILKPWRHYVALKKDHSNFDEVARVLRDDRKIAELVATAFSEIGANEEYSYRAFVARVDGVLDATWDGRMEPAVIRYDREAFQKRWPFYFIPNPHAAMSVPAGHLLKAGAFVRRILPTRVKEAMRLMIKHR